MNILLHWRVVYEILFTKKFRRSPSSKRSSKACAGGLQYVRGSRRIVLRDV
jgi:hypothetical protein